MARTLWDIIENPKNKRWYLTVSSGIKKKDIPDVEAILKRSAEHRINPHTLLSKEILETSLERIIPDGEEEISFPIVIEPTFDVRLIISPDKTAASLYIRKSSDPKNPLDLKLISTVLNNNNLAGMDSEKVQSAISDFRNSPNMELPELLLAEGTPASRGTEREFVALVEWLPAAETAAILPRILECRKKRKIVSESTNIVLDQSTKMSMVNAGTIVFSFSPVELGSPGIDVFGKKIPGLPGNDPFIQIAGALSLGPTGVRADKDGILVSSGTGPTLCAELHPYKDAQVTISVSENRLKAIMHLEPEEGPGIVLTPELAHKAIAAIGLKGDINFNSLKKEIETARSLKRSIDTCILEGIPAVQPGEFRVSWKKKPGTEINPTFVNQGDEILLTEKLPKGSDGIDVYGEVTPAAKAVKQNETIHDATIQKSPKDNGECYKAATSGILVLVNGTLQVSNELRISGEINDERGDITFSGNVEVAGNIGNSRSVRAGKSLKVFGNAGVSLLSADESVQMHGGIKGMGRGTVWAKKEISLQFAENARLLAGGNITVDNYCFQCTVKTNQKLIMQGKPAVLMGGNIRASMGVEVYELGSPKTIRTSISFGQNYLVSDQTEVCEQELSKIADMTARIDAEMKRIDKSNPKIHDLRRKKLELMKRKDKLTVRVFTLKEQFETHIPSSIRVEKTVYPGVILESHGRYHQVREKRSHVIFYFDLSSGQIICKPIENE